MTTSLIKNPEKNAYNKTILEKIKFGSQSAHAETINGTEFSFKKENKLSEIFEPMNKIDNKIVRFEDECGNVKTKGNVSDNDNTTSISDTAKLKKTTAQKRKMKNSSMSKVAQIKTEEVKQEDQISSVSDMNHPTTFVADNNSTSDQGVNDRNNSTSNEKKND